MSARHLLQTYTDTNATDSLFVFISAVLVFFMHTGFAMVECGGVQAKNRQAILIKNVMLVATSCLSFWAFGYVLQSDSVDGDKNGFMGTNFAANAFLNKTPKDGNTLINWYFAFAFAATAATIISGSVAERTHFRAYIVYSAITTAFVYPVVAYWGWNDDGFLKKAGSANDTTQGYMDFAGSGLVHMVGGCAGLMGAILVGPRRYMDTATAGVYAPRFAEDGSVNQPAMGQSSIAFSTLGTLILWVGWYGFNPGSEFAITGSSLDVVGLVTVNTTMGPAAAAFTYFLFSFCSRAEGSDLGGILNSALGGLVAVTANCNCVQPWAAVVIGAVAAFVYTASSWMLKYMKVDDVIDASPVHYFCGIWGVIATGLFASDDLLGGGHEAGLFYGGGTLLGWQIVGVLAITAWTALITALFMGAMKYSPFGDLLRISEEEEKLGLDKLMEQNSYNTVTTPTYKSKKLKEALDVEAGPAAVVHLEVADARAAVGESA